MTQTLLFLSLMVPITWSPGPNNIMSASVGGKYGVLRSIPFIIGLNVSNIIYAIGTGFGLGIIMEKYPVTVEILKYAGGVYVFYLGWKIITSHLKTKAKTKDMGFLSGFIISSLNVKSITVIMLMYSQLLRPDMNLITEVLTLSFSFVLLCIIGHFGWAFIGEFSSKIFLSSKAIKIQNYVFGGMLFCTGVWILVG